MFNFHLLKEIGNDDKDKAVENLITNSSPRQSYYFMVAMSIMMATLGLMLDSIEVVIGSMLIAPVLYPILSLSMGIIISDKELIFRSFSTLVRSILLALIISGLTAVIFSSQQGDLTHEIIKRTQPNILNFAVALIAGMAVAYAITKPNINEAMPGVAISVSLVPPLAVVGIGLSNFDISVAAPAFVLFIVNIIGIMFSAMVIFSLMQFVTKRRKVHSEFMHEKKLLERE